MTTRTSPSGKGAALLEEAGCRRIFEEKAIRCTAPRPAMVLTRLLDHIREQDVLVVARLDRLARSTRDLLEIAELLRDAGADLRSLGEPWADTTSAAGRMVLTVFAGIAEFERALIHQRTTVGRNAAIKRGVRFGRPVKLAAEQIALGQRLIEEGTSSPSSGEDVQGPSRHPLSRAGSRNACVPRAGCSQLTRTSRIQWWNLTDDQRARGAKPGISAPLAPRLSHLQRADHRPPCRPESAQGQRIVVVYVVLDGDVW